MAYPHKFLDRTIGGSAGTVTKIITPKDAKSIPMIGRAASCLMRCSKNVIYSITSSARGIVQPSGSIGNH